MKNIFTIAVLMLGLSVTANADVWKWIDAKGKTHFVDTMKPIFMWIDDWGKTNYSDKPDHEDAVSVELVWHSSGSLQETSSTEEAGLGGYSYPGETAEERAERERAQAYYCKRATEVYDSYLNAPQLYRTSPDGEHEYLSTEEAAQTIAETLVKRNEYCQ